MIWNEFLIICLWKTNAYTKRFSCLSCWKMYGKSEASLVKLLEESFSLHPDPDSFAEGRDKTRELRAAEFLTGEEKKMPFAQTEILLDA